MTTISTNKEAKHMELRGLSSNDIWDVENAYYWFSHPSRICKLLVQYELYKSIVNLPGAVFELGVYKATSLIRFTTFRRALENDFSRKIVGFDAFGKFPRDNISMECDRHFIDQFESNGGLGLERTEVLDLLRRKNFENVELIKGNVLNTIPDYIEENPSTRISILHLDMDVKEPTEYALQTLYDRVVPGGIIIFDDYEVVSGETDAVDAFLDRHGLSIEKNRMNYIPSFVRKPAK